MMFKQFKRGENVPAVTRDLSLAHPGDFSRTSIGGPASVGRHGI